MFFCILKLISGTMNLTKRFHNLLKEKKKRGGKKKKKSPRVIVKLEHSSEAGAYRYHTSKNRRNTTTPLKLRKYSPLTRKHEIFKEVK
jgi:large subunit ribosomal protein L33